MNVKDRRVIENIIRIYPYLCGLQEKIEKEQDGVIADLVSPAERVVERLIELDNRRIDLCNLAVLYRFIERGLGERFGLLCSYAHAGEDSPLYAEAIGQIQLAGYTTERAGKEFAYIFKLLKRHSGGGMLRAPAGQSATFPLAF